MQYFRKTAHFGRKIALRCSRIHKHAALRCSFFDQTAPFYKSPKTIQNLAISLIIMISILAVGVVSFPRYSSAAVASGCKSGSVLGLPSWYEYLDVGPKPIKDNKGNVVAVDKCGITGPLDVNGGLDWGKAGGKIGLAIVDILLRISAVVTVGFIILGGIRLTLSGGEPDKFKHAKDTVINALIGLVVVMVATAAVNFVGRTLIK